MALESESSQDVPFCRMCQTSGEDFYSIDLFTNTFVRLMSIPTVQVEEKTIEDGVEYESDDADSPSGVEYFKSPTESMEIFIPISNNEKTPAESSECQAYDLEFGGKCDVNQNEAHGIGTQENTAEDHVNSCSDQSCSKEIQISASLRQIKKDASSIEKEYLSTLEMIYISKCKARVDIYRALKCACYLATHPNLNGLMAILSSVSIWFPVFTCYNCMITFTDRSSMQEHILKCPNKHLDKLVKLSNQKKRSTLKTRIYQNYKCTECNLIFSFHEDICRHIDEEHCNKIAPYNCSCQRTFDALDDYKDHIYVSCLVKYYCDICHIAFGTLKNFLNHSQNRHDGSASLPLQNENYEERTLQRAEPKQNEGILGKRSFSTYDETDDESEARRKFSRMDSNILT